MNVLIKKVIVFLALSITVFAVKYNSIAQDKKNKKIVIDGPVMKIKPISGVDTNNTIPVDSFTQILRVSTAPEFYFRYQKTVADSTYEYECYTKKDSLIPYVTNFDEVAYFSLIRTYIDVTHTYKDKEGIEQPLPVKTIEFRYDKKGKNKWMTVDYSTKQYVELTEYKDEIVSTDTTYIEDRIHHVIYTDVLNLYRVKPAGE